MNAKDQKSKTSLAGGESTGVAAEGASVDKIRDILFGGQMRDYDKKFAYLEERLLKETNSLRDEVKKSLGAFDTFVKQELESLSSRLKTEHDQRVAALKEAARDLKEVQQGLQERAAQLDDLIAKNQRELRQQVLEQHRSLSDEIRKRADEAAAALKRESAELRADKTDRTALAALFTEMALRLKDEFKIPVVEQKKG